MNDELRTPEGAYKFRVLVQGAEIMIMPTPLF